MIKKILNIFKKQETPETPLSILTYKVYEGGRVETEITFEDFESDTLKNFGELLGNIATDEYSLATMEILKTNLDKENKGNYFTKVVSYAINRMHELDRVEEKRLKEENKDTNDETCVDSLDILR